ncbi:MAG TPA: hypothetical protein PLP33_10325 [Leptospiraceae bacterium]|nr:hypothetical protein [Leptospiraceae bacterium]
MEAKENKVVLRRAELKNMIKELIKEMVASGELASVFNSGTNSSNPMQMQGKYGLDPNMTNHISTLASVVAGNDPTKKNVLEAIFADTAKVTNPQQARMEMNPPTQTFFNQGAGHPAFTAVSNQQIGYTGNDINTSYPVQAPQQGYIPYGNGSIPQAPQQPQMHPLAKIAFKHPLKNTLDNS